MAVAAPLSRQEAVEAEITHLGELVILLSGELDVAKDAIRALGSRVKHLEASAAKTWYPAQPNFPAGFAAFNTAFEDITVNSYLIWDARSKTAAVFDTGASCEAMLDTIHAEKLTLQYIFLTHTHDDHIADLARLATDTKAEVWASEREPAPIATGKTFKENVHFHVGPLSIKTLLTSGHSPGLTTYYVSGLSWPLAVVGDAIFAGSMGGSSTHYDEQLRNNKDKILSMPKDTVLACGHGPLTTLGQEKQHNPFFAR